MAERMKVGFVGCGAFCSGIHIPNVAKNPSFQIVAFCDLDETRLGDLDRQYDVKYVTTDMTRLIRDPQIELVICGTKPHDRMEIMELSVEHKKHLFVEKPLCCRREEVESMVRLMNGAETLFMVGFNRPYCPMMQDIKPLYHKQKTAGAGNTTIIYRIVGEAQLWPPVWQKMIIEKGESSLVHETVHIFDLLNWLTDLEPVRVYVSGGGNMDNVVTLDYPDDITAVIISGDNSTSGWPKERIEINTNHGTIVGEFFVELFTCNVNGDAIHKTYEYEVAGATYDGGVRQCAELGWEWRKGVTDEQRRYGYYYDKMPKPNKGHYEELELFRRMILAGGPSVTDVVRGAMANLTAWCALESWEKGAPVDLDFSYLRNL